jgi:hypothetical protein
MRRPGNLDGAFKIRNYLLGFVESLRFYCFVPNNDVMDDCSVVRPSPCAQPPFNLSGHLLLLLFLK